MSSPYQPQQPYPATPSGGSRIAAILAHLSAPIAALISVGWLSMLGPLIVWLVKKDDPYARRAAAGAFNFNLTFWLLYLISWLLIFTVIGAVVGIPMIIVLFLVSGFTVSVLQPVFGALACAAAVLIARRLPTMVDRG